MRIDGRWLVCDDGFERPFVPAHLLLPTRHLARIDLLLDTGADFTLLSYALGQSLAVYALAALVGVQILLPC